MRAQARHRATRRHDPESTLIYAALLLIVTFGLLLAAMHEAMLAGDDGWMVFFSLATIADVALYFWIAQGWIMWALTPAEDDVEDTDPNG